MEKYILGENIIKTTPERYEREFKALGYEPYKEAKIEENASNTKQDADVPVEKTKRKRN